MKIIKELKEQLAHYESYKDVIHYSKVLTKEYLELMGVRIVSLDGKHIYVLKNGKLIEAKQITTDDIYYSVKLEDVGPDKLPYYVKHKDKRVKIGYSYEVGKRQCLVHQIVYAWFNGSCPENGDQIDHIDNDASNNFLTNLQSLSAAQNSAKIIRRRPRKPLIVRKSWTCGKCLAKIYHYEKLAQENKDNKSKYDSYKSQKARWNRRLKAVQEAAKKEEK